jgi:NAD(P) transhydrogenase
MNITRIPKSLCIVGAGVIGCEFATIFSTLGVKVFLNNRGATMLPFCDQEIVKELYLQMEGSGIQFEFGKTVKSVEQNDMLNVTFDSGECLEVDMLLFAANRKCSVEMLKPENAQLKLSENGLIPVNEYYQTNQPHIYAAGDVIGYPSLANVSQDQGRAAVSHMFKMHDMESFSSMSFPIGIYTIPEISSVGLSEEKAISLGKEICIGRAYHADVARGIIMGAKRGFLKLVVNRHTQQVLGVHIIGHLASELIHEGVELIHNKKTLLDIISKNFNFPSLHELYKYAAYDALSYLTGRKMKARF